ncbi:MAG: hypothetical protein Sw1PiTSA_30600 [Shewanella algae]
MKDENILGEVGTNQLESIFKRWRLYNQKKQNRQYFDEKREPATLLFRSTHN